MFCIYKNELKIADHDMPCSHAEWFEKEGWISIEEDSFMCNGVRGYVDSNGDIFFYTGWDFGIDSEIEKEFFKYLMELMERLEIKKPRIFGGMKKEQDTEVWKPMKEYNQDGFEI